MPETRVNVLMACSVASRDAIAGALRERAGHLALHRIEDRHNLRRSLEEGHWHLVFSDLEMPDFTALDLATLASDLGAAPAIVVVRGTGAEGIAARCVALGLCHAISLDAAHLGQLPALVDTLVRRAEQEQSRRLTEVRQRMSLERYVDIFLSDVLHPDSLLCCQDRFQRLLGGETLSCINFKFVAKSGKTVHLMGDCGSLFKEGGAVSTRGIFKNMTDIVRAEEALRITEARYQALYENAPDIYTSIDADGTILSINRTGARMLGYEDRELIGESAAKVIHPEDQRVVFDCLQRLFSDPRECHDIEYRKIRKDGTVFWVHQRATLDPGTGAPRLLVVCRDITDRRNLEAQLAHQATHDALTNLVNRREFERRLHRVLSGDADPAERHVLCFLDLDQFKAINDSRGHMAGDELLRELAALLKAQVRSRDTLARVGGDEFAILMEHASLEKAVILAEKIRAAVEGFQFHWRSECLSIGVSIGVVPIGAGQSVVDMLNIADMACYRAKKAGRNRIHAEALPD